MISINDDCTSKISRNFEFQSLRSWDFNFSVSPPSSACPGSGVEILVPDWPITCHVTWMTNYDWFFTSVCHAGLLLGCRTPLEIENYMRTSSTSLYSHCHCQSEYVISCFILQEIYYHYCCSVALPRSTNFSHNARATDVRGVRAYNSTGTNVRCSRRLSAHIKSVFLKLSPPFSCAESFCALPCVI